MERRVSKKANLVSRVLGGAAVAAGAVLGTGKSADGGNIYLNSNFGNTNAPDVYLWHETGSTDGFDSPGNDVTYGNPSSPVVDFYSMITGHNLSEDSRGILKNPPNPALNDSTFYTKIQGRGLNGLTEGNLKFEIAGGTDFPDYIRADVYKNGSTTPFQTVDVRAYAADPSKQIDLSLASNSDYYNIDVRFAPIPEPSTISLLAMAGIAGAGVAAYSASRRKKEE